jgi:DNA helicase II / ATP-dependent DNA helicase PcrA
VREAVTRLRGTARSGEADGADDWVDVVRATLAGMGWTPQPPTARGQTRDRWESWQALVDQAAEFAVSHPEGELNAFVDDLDRRASEQHAPVADGVTLATFHAAKGLEWDAVFLCGLQDGTLPITYAETPAAIEEERRLLYVGMTRARLDLHLSWALSRNPGGRASRKPSRFLDPLLPDEARAQRDLPQKRKVASCRECGKPLATGAEKKRGRAGEESVPAFVVFTDATLQMIAEQKPRTPEALLRISGIGRSKLERYGEDVLALTG